MSKSKIAIPPFTEEEDEVAILPQSSKNQATLTEVLAGDNVREARSSRKRHQIEGSQPEDRNKKSKKEKEPAMPPPLPPPANTVANTFAKLGHQFTSEVDLQSWSLSDIEENNAQLTKAVSEAFIRQASHHKEIRSLFHAKTKLEKEIQSLKEKLEASEEESRLAAVAHKKHVEEATASLKNELSDANRKISELEVARAEEEKKRTELEEKATIAADERAQAIADATALGKVQFMKSFMKKLPNFDWNQLGVATGKYADDLRVEMAEEARKKAEEAEARRLAEEAKNREAPDETPAA